MSLQMAVAAAIRHFPAVLVATSAGTVDLRAVMVAIAGAETDGSWSGSAAGDPLSIYRDGGAAEQAYSCGGKTSFGVWQVNLPSHAAMVAALSGIPASNPCGQAAWLADFANAAKAAYAVYRSQGLGAWTTYQTGKYLHYLAKAQAAVSAALAATTPPPTSQPPTSQPPATLPPTGQNPWAPIAVVGAVGLLAVATLVAAPNLRRKSGQYLRRVMR